MAFYTETYDKIFVTNPKNILSPNFIDGKKVREANCRTITMAEVNLMEADLSTIFPQFSTEDPHKNSIERLTLNDFTCLKKIDTSDSAPSAATEFLSDIEKLVNDYVSPEFFEELERGISEIDSMLFEKKAPPENDIEKCDSLYQEAIKYKNEKNYRKAYELWLEAARQSHSPSSYQIGKLYFKGKFLAQSYIAAKFFFSSAAKKGHPGALDYMGKIFEKGLGVKIDHRKAFKYYLKASAMEKPRAMNHLGLMYLRGKGIKNNNTLAIKCFKEAVKKNHDKAMNNLAFLFYQGIGLKQDYYRAKIWYEEAARNGNVDALYNLAHMHKKGEGVDVDLEKAWEYIKKAVKKGHTASMVVMAQWFKDEKNRDSCLYWLKKAAGMGNANAMYLYGDMTIHEDFDHAFPYFLKAARKGHPQARKRLNYK